MRRYIARRMVQGVITVILLAGIVFVLSRVTGDPLDILLPIDASLEMRENMAAQLGLDRPLPEQFLRYMADVVRGDFGVSIEYRASVMELFLDRYPNTLRLILPAFVLAFLTGVPLGVVAAKSRFRIVRQSLTIFGVLGMATPLFWFALVLILIFSVNLGVLPASRMGGFQSHVLPVVALSLLLVAGIMRLVRASMLEALDSEYVKMARLKGMSERRVVWKHALRNSLTSAVSFLGVYFAVLVTGSIVIEKVFAWPGVGRLLYEGIVGRDYPVVQGLVLLSALLILVVNLLVDMAYAYLDPRIRYE